MAGDDLLDAVRTLIDLADRSRAEQAAERLATSLSVADLLRAADGAQQVARALASTSDAAADPPERSTGHDPHDVRSLYS